MKNPFAIFKNWYQTELEQSKLRIPSACCLSSIGTDGYPNSRFVSLKELKNKSFIITGSLNSRKGLEIQQNPKVSLSFWWTTTQRQIRIQGEASFITEAEAKVYFDQRSQDSKIVSTVFEQGKTIENFASLHQRFNSAKLKKTVIEKPSDWSGFAIRPIRIEFMEFKASRLHERMLFTEENGDWIQTYLQP